MIKRLFLIIVSLAFLLNCEKKSNENPQVLRVNFYSKCRSFHPHKPLDISDMTICKNLYEGLTRLNLENKIELALAEKVEISPCKTKYTFTLKDSIWSNQEKVKADHFVQAWKQALDPNQKQTPQARRFFLIRNAKKIYQKTLPIDQLGVFVPDDRTIIIELEHPAPYFLELLADPVYSPIFDLTEQEPTVFNGPFGVKKFEPEKKLSLKANPSYWDAETVRLDEVQISFILDENTAFSMYEQGQFDWVGSPFTEIPLEVLRSNPKVKKRSTTSPYWIFFNVENEWLKSINIRKALSYAVDRSELVKRVVPYQKQLHGIMPDELSLVNSSEFCDNCNIKNAQKLFEKGLKELGLKREEVSFTINHSSYAEQERVAIYLKDLWEKVFNITINLKKDDWNTFVVKIRKSDYEIGGCYICNIYSHPSHLLQGFEGDGSYLSKWSNKQFKKIIQKSRQATEEEDEKYFLKQAEEILLEEMPVVPLYHQTHMFLCKDRLKNVFPPKFMYTDFKWAYFENKDGKANTLKF